jgi:hypothetical protein
MYINYLNNRKELGFICIKDINSVEQLLDFRSSLKNSSTYMVQKSNQTFIFIFSKEMIVTVLIFLESIYLKPIIDCPLFLSSEVEQSSISIIISVNLELTSSPTNSLLGIEGLGTNGGSDEWDEFTDEKQQKLTQSVLAKSPQSSEN